MIETILPRRFSTVPCGYTLEFPSLPYFGTIIEYQETDFGRIGHSLDAPDDF
jgi:hypothetical protein